MKAVIFDLDDTLYKTVIGECNRLVINAVADRYKLPYSVVAEAFEYGKKITKELLPDVAATHNRILYIQHMLEYLGENALTDSLEWYDLFWDSFLDMIELRPGAEKALSELKNQGIKMGICTDLTAHIQHRKVQKLGLDRLVDFMVSSEEAGVEKPARAIFDLAVKKSKCTKDDILYIGDHIIKDYEGAKSFGLNALLYKEENYPDFYIFYEKEIKQWI